jgi:hypothetical protein
VRRIGARVGAPHGEGGSGSRRQGERSHTEGERKGKGARRDPYHARKLLRRPAVGDWRRRGGIATARGSVDGGAVLGPSGSTCGARARGKLGEIVAAEEERERAAGSKKGRSGLGVRVVRATAPAPSAGRCGSASPKRGQASRTARARARVRRKGSGRAAERGHGQWPSGRPAKGKTEEGARKGERRS